MSNRRVSLPVALAIPQQFPSRLSPPTPSSPAANRRSLPTSPICRRSLPSTPRTVSPRRLTNLLPDVDEHFASTSSSSENSPRRVKKRRPPPRYQYSLQTASSTMSQNTSEEIDEKPEGTLRSFGIKNGQVTDNGYKQMNMNGNQTVVSHNYKDRRATCPEVWLFQETSNTPMQHIVFRIYGSKNCGKKTLLRSINEFATKLVSKYNNESTEEEENSSKTLNFLLNNEQIEMEMLLESTLENSPFASSLTMYAVVYNVDNRESFISATELLNRLLNRKIARGSNIILVGNKIDLKRNTVVSKMEGACLAKVHKCNFVEVSAQYSMNISDLWTLVLKQIQAPKNEEQEEPNGWMHRIVSRGRQLAHSAEQIVQKFL
uniref:GTP-binding protein n=1 Tax=Caenorhabditis tropicalis TaxID=1561998 RepID=A0A1I7T834_9PELO